jgi:hypothetical protein
MSKKNVVWLASYPKSGNTWFRVFLTNLLNETNQPAHINDLTETSISSSRKIFDEYSGLSSSDLSFDEIDRIRPEVYKMQSNESENLLFKKVHDKFYWVNEYQPLFPPEISFGAIYFIRNPLDVLVSFSYHSAKPIEKMITAINNPAFAFCDKNDMLQNQLRQILGTWSDHVKSWTNQDLIPLQVIRYEDMILDTFNTFKSAVQFLKIVKTDNQIAAAIQKSDFNILSKQEKESGFKEKMIKSKSFFRKGKIGDWHNILTNDQRDKVIQKNIDIMKIFGYLNERNEPIY